VREPQTAALNRRYGCNRTANTVARQPQIAGNRTAERRQENWNGSKDKETIKVS